MGSVPGITGWLACAALVGCGGRTSLDLEVSEDHPDPEFGPAVGSAEILALEPDYFGLVRNNARHLTIDGATAEGPHRVSAMLDLTPHGRHLTSGGHNEPLLVLRGFDWALAFDEADGNGGDSLTLPTALTSALSGSTQLTMLVAYRRTSTAPSQVLLGSDNADLRIAWSSNSHVLAYVGGRFGSMPEGTIRKPHLLLLEYDGLEPDDAGRVKLELDGAQYPELDFDGATPTAVPLLSDSTFGTWGGLTGFGGEIYGIVAFARKLSTEEKDLLYAAIRGEINWAASLPFPGTAFAQSSQTIGVNGNVDEAATGVTLTVHSTATVFDKHAPHVAFPAVIGLGGQSFRCVFRDGLKHAGGDTTAKLVYSDSHDDGATWSLPVDVVDTPEVDDRDPTLYYRDGELRIGWHKYVSFGVPFAQQAYDRAFSGNDEVALAGFPLTVSAHRFTGRPKTYDNGSIHVLYGAPYDYEEPSRIGFLDRNAGTLRWLGTGPRHFFEPDVHRVDTSTLLMAVRTSPETDSSLRDTMVLTRSTDNGSTWTEAAAFSSICDAPFFFRHSSGVLLLGCREVEAGHSWTTLFWTPDDGFTWGKFRVFVHGPNVDAAYPAIAERLDGKLLVVHYEPSIIRASIVGIE